MSEQTLASLAILTVNWDRGHDAIESFVPIVADCVRRNGDGPVSLVELQRRVEDEAGIRIPSGALQSILARCAREGLVKRQNKVYVPNEEKLDKLSYAADHTDAVRRHRALLTKLQEFARERYSTEWDDDTAERHLVAFLKEGSVPVLAAAAEGDPLPGGKEQSRKAKHILSAFVLHLSEDDPEGFGCLEVVVKGFVLSGVLFYPDLGRVETKLKGLEVYCDTPFLLKALGYGEEGRRVQARDLLELLSELGADLRCFHHTREELAGVLEAESAALRRGEDGRTVVSFAGTELRREDIEEMLVSIDKTLGQLGVAVVDTPDWQSEPDEVSLDEALDKMHYQRDRAREKDVQSLAAVARLRGLHRVDAFEKAEAIFVTTNTTLARISSRFFREMEGASGIPICLSVETMTRLAWVKKPLSAPDLPRHMIIASSYAALNPSNELWRKYLEAIQRRREKGMLSDEDYHLLRSSREAREALMGETLGEEEAFSAGTLDEVLEHAKSAIRGEQERETAEQRARADRAEAEAERHQTRAANLERAHRNRVDKDARRLGDRVGTGVAAAVGLLLVIGLLATVPGFPLLEIKSLIIRVFIWACVAVFVLLSIYGFVFRQMSVQDMRAEVSGRVRTWKARRGHAELDALHADQANEESS